MNNCPNCGTILDGVTPIHGPSSPRPDDYSICIRCGTILQFNEDFSLRIAEGELPPKVKRDFDMFKMWLKSRTN